MGIKIIGVIVIQRINIVSLMFPLLFIMCNLKQKKIQRNVPETIQTKQKRDESNKLSKPSSSSKIYYSEEKTVDTLIAGFNILYEIRNNGKFIINDYVDSEGNRDTLWFADREVTLSIDKNSNPIFLNRLVNQIFFNIPIEEREKYMLMYFDLKHLSNDSIIFDVCFTIPETGVFYAYEYKVFGDGKEEVNMLDCVLAPKRVGQSYRIKSIIILLT